MTVFRRDDKKIQTAAPVMYDALVKVMDTFSATAGGRAVAEMLSEVHHALAVAGFFDDAQKDIAEWSKKK